jgi:DNA-binding IclR family transcriptional regulator
MGRPGTSDKESTYQVRALERGLSVLEGFVDSGEAVSLSDIAKRHDLNLSTAFRLVRVLTQMRWLEPDEQGNHYRLGVRAFEVGSRYLTQLRVEEVARPILESLAQETGQTASLGVIEGPDVVYVGIVHGQQEVGIQSRIGARHPAYCTALGKALLSEADDALLKEVVGNGMPQRTEYTITMPDVLRHELQEVRRLGYAVDNEERVRGIYCVAAPVRNHEQRVIAAISVSAPVFAVTPEARFKFAQLVVQAAGDVSVRLGAMREGASNHREDQEVARGGNWRP